MVDPRTPYGLSGLIYDINSTVIDGATVKATNTRTEDITTTTTNSLGQYTLDLANFTSVYATNDIIFVQAWKKGTPFKMTSFTFKLTGDSKELDLHLKPVFNKRLRTEDLKQIQLNNYSDEYLSLRTVNNMPKNGVITRDANGNPTTVVEYTEGVKKTTTMTWDSSNDLTSWEIK